MAGGSSASGSSSKCLENVRIGSAGYKAGNFSCFIMGSSKQKNGATLLVPTNKRWKRGWNIVYQLSPELDMKAANFDPYDTSKDDTRLLIEFLQKLDSAHLVMISVKDEGGRKFDQMASLGLEKALVDLRLRANCVKKFMEEFGKRQSLAIICGRRKI